MALYLQSHQIKAVHEAHPGCVIRGGVGVGKTIIALAYFLTKECGSEGKRATILDNGRVDTSGLEVGAVPDLYVITTAKKRQSLDWVKESAHFGFGPEREYSVGHGALHVDSWNNIGRYTEVEGAVFIFDEQRLVGSGAWVKAFYKIAKRNKWIMLSATPADSWMDYVPVFVGNGFYKNKTEFIREHVVYNNFSRYPKVERFIGQSRLEQYRSRILIDVEYTKSTIRQTDYINLPYDKELFDLVWKKRWNPYENRPARTIAEVFYLMRRVVNSDPSRLERVRTTLKEHPRLIVFYNFNYELEILRQLSDDYVVKEWNGKQHDELPEGDSWVYLVQYTAGAEGWNCITTDTTLFYSLTYSYRSFEQSHGRIDRMNTPFKTLNYIVLRSESMIDQAVSKALSSKKNFNVNTFVAKTEISAHF